MSILQKLERLPGWKPARELHSPGANLEDEASKKLAVWVYGDSTLPAHANLQMVSAQLEKISDSRLWMEDAYLLRQSRYQEQFQSLVKSEEFKDSSADLCSLVGVDPAQMCSLFITFVSEEDVQPDNEKALVDKLEIATNFSFFVPTLILCQTQNILVRLDQALSPGAQKNLWLNALTAPLLYQTRVAQSLANLISSNNKPVGTET